MDNILSKDVVTSIAAQADVETQLKMRQVNTTWNRGVTTINIEKVKRSEWEEVLSGDDWIYGPFEDYILEEYKANKNFVEWVINEEPSVNIQELVSLLSKRSQIMQSISDIYFYQTGENDEHHWYLLGIMNVTTIGMGDATTSLYFFMDASCDYTGFSCRGSINFVFGHTLENVIKLGMTQRSRRALSSFQKDKD